MNSKNYDGGTALHEAVFMGRDDIAEFLLPNGADKAAVDNADKVVLSRGTTKWDHALAKMGEWRIERDPRDIYGGRLAIANLFLDDKEAENVDTATRVKEQRNRPVWRLFTHKAIAYHLWFLWHMCLLLPVFVFLYAFCTQRWRGLPPRWVHSSLSMGCDTSDNNSAVVHVSTRDGGRFLIRCLADYLTTPESSLLLRHFYALRGTLLRQ